MDIEFPADIEPDMMAAIVVSTLEDYFEKSEIYRVMGVRGYSITLEGNRFFMTPLFFTYDAPSVEAEAAD